MTTLGKQIFDREQSKLDFVSFCIMFAKVGVAIASVQLPHCTVVTFETQIQFILQLNSCS